MDTIFALASAQGRAGVSVLRISGPDARSVAAGVCGTLPGHRQSALRSLRDEKGALLDQALVLFFEGPASFTGEDVVEFHVHGSIAIVQALLTSLSRDPRARIAEPGEFTRRALENNRLDLAQVEGLSDLIDAETEAQRKQAVRVFSGALGEKAEQWRAALIRAAALIEATIDFADEEVPLDVTPEVNALLTSVQSELQAEIEGSHIAERIRSGFEVALIGAPNTGKSTLLNRLAGREAAITSEIAGTTRDVIEVRMDLSGLPVTFLDTAGLRDSEDAIESIGIERALQRAQQADVRIFLVNPGDVLPIEMQTGDIRVAPKADLYEGAHFSVSGKTGEGVGDLIERIKSVLFDRASDAGLATHERHRSCMTHALDGLSSAQEVLRRGPDFYDIAAEEMRSSIRSLETLVGRIDVESLLDEIFSSFCLGK
jgi:tRNA modification GTPase